MNKKQRMVFLFFFASLFLMSFFGTKFKVSRLTDIIGIAAISIITSVLMRMAKDPKHSDSN